MNATPQGAFYRFLTDSLTPNCLFKAYALSKVYSVQQPGILVSGTRACAPGAHGSAAGHEDTKLPEHGESKQPPAQPCHHQPAMGAARALCQFLSSPATWGKLKQPCVLHEKFTSEGGRGGTEQAEYMRAKRKISAALSNFPLSPEGERAHGTPPHPFPPLFAVYCSESGLLFIHAITNSAYLLYSDTKMPFHLQNKISRSPNCQGQQMK